MQHKTGFEVRVEPHIQQWPDMLAPMEGELFGQSLAKWRQSAKRTLGLSPDKPIVVVGHQPIFFHPGILAKFIAGHHIAKQLGGVLTYLVVDHQLGITGNVEILEEVDGDLKIREVRVGKLDPRIAMKDQDRVKPIEVLEPISTTLEQAQGENAAMQYAHASKTLMAPWAIVHHVVAGCDLLHTEIGKAILQEMDRDPDRCITTYNEAVSCFPNCEIPPLDTNELPVWHGMHNERISTVRNDLRPRALLLTLLARLTVADLFIHGIGGAAYDEVMVHWMREWLGVEPCPSTMVTATLTLSSVQQSIDDARREYYSPEGETITKSMLVESIADAPYKSLVRQDRYQAMQAWLSTVGTHPDASAYRRKKRMTDRRDWAFPLYPHALLNQLRDAIISE